MYFASPTANRSAYFGGGLSYGRTTIRTVDAEEFSTSGHGAGLQGELTVGYEIARVTSARLFAQADVTLPFYDVVTERFSYPPRQLNGPFVAPTVTIERQYAPSVAVSVGFGWQRRAR